MSLQLAMKVNIVLHYWIGFIGMHLLVTRVIGVTFLPAVIYLATLVTASGAPAIHLRVGHSVFLPGFYLPLQLFFFFRAYQTGEWKYIFAAAATLALMVFNGGTHILPMSIAALGTFAVCAAIARRDWRPLAFVAVFGAAGLAYSAPKLIPVVQYVGGDYFWDTRNPTEKPDLRNARHPEADLPRPDTGRGLAPADAAARLARVRQLHRHSAPRSRSSLGLIWVFSTACLAEARSAKAGDATLVRHLPRGHHHRVVPAVARRIQPLLARRAVAVPAAVFELQDPEPLHDPVPAVRGADAGMGVSIGDCSLTASRNGRASRSRWSCLGAAAHLIYVNQWNLKSVFNETPFDTTFHWMSGPRQITTDADSSAYTGGSPMLRALMNDRSFFNCYESLQLARGAGPIDPQVFDANPSARVSELDFSPNRLTFSVTDGPGDEARVVLNQNWGPGWTTRCRADHGRPAHRALDGDDPARTRAAATASRSRRRGFTRERRCSRSR